MATGFCIRARWASAVVALLIVGASILNYWKGVNVGIPLQQSHLWVSVSSATLRIGVSRPLLDNVPFFWLTPEWIMDIRGIMRHGWRWTWMPSVFFNPNARPNYSWLGITLPLWIPLAAATGVAAVGCWRRRRQWDGLCRACGHTLAGAALCFECGTACDAALPEK